MGAILMLVGAAVVFAVATRSMPWQGAALYFGWALVAAALALSGALPRYDLRPPPFAILFVGSLVVALALGLSRIGAQIAATVPVAWLIGAQVFRLPLELAMHWGSFTGIVPHALTFDGYNFDVLTGASALPVAWLVARGNIRLAWGWSMLGFAALTSIVIVALLGSPFLRFFGESEVNTWVAYFPYCEVPAMLVVFAMASQICVIRALRALQRQGSPS